MWSAGPLPGGVFTMNDDTGTPSPCLSPSNSDAVELERSSSSGMTIATLGGGVALLSPGPRLGRLDLAVLGRSVGHELAEQLARDRRDRLDRALERLLVRPGRLGVAADLPDVLEGRGLDLLLGGGGLVIVKGADVSGHAGELSRRDGSSWGGARRRQPRGPLLVSRRRRRRLACRLPAHRPR